MSSVNVRVSRRVLWVGGQAYPLQNIARVATVRGKPNPVLDRLSATGCMILPIIFLLMVLSMVAVAAHLTALVIGFWVLVVIAWIYALVDHLARKRAYSLVIETAGSSLAVLSSKNKAGLDRIVWEIMKAIDNERVEFQAQV